MFLCHFLYGHLVLVGFCPILHMSILVSSLPLLGWKIINLPTKAQDRLAGLCLTLMPWLRKMKRGVAVLQNNFHHHDRQKVASNMLWARQHQSANLWTVFFEHLLFFKLHLWTIKWVNFIIWEHITEYRHNWPPVTFTVPNCQRKNFPLSSTVGLSRGFYASQ